MFISLSYNFYLTSANPRHYTRSFHTAVHPCDLVAPYLHVGCFEDQRYSIHVWIIHQHFKKRAANSPFSKAFVAVHT